MSAPASPARRSEAMVFSRIVSSPDVGLKLVPAPRCPTSRPFNRLFQYRQNDRFIFNCTDEFNGEICF